MRLEIAVRSDGARRFLQQRVKDARDLQPFFKGPAQQVLAKAFDAQFASEGAFFGEPWAPLGEARLAFKRRKNRAGYPILRYTGALRKSFTSRADPKGIRRATNTGLLYGSAVPYARYHQDGNPRLPQRRIIPRALPPAVLTSLRNAFRSYLAATLR